MDSREALKEIRRVSDSMNCLPTHDEYWDAVMKIRRILDAHDHDEMQREWD